MIRIANALIMIFLRILDLMMDTTPVNKHTNTMPAGHQYPVKKPRVKPIASPA